MVWLATKADYQYQNGVQTATDGRDCIVLSVEVRDAQNNMITQKWLESLSSPRHREGRDELFSATSHPLSFLSAMWNYKPVKVRTSSYSTSKDK